MDLNYLYQRQQVSLMQADAAASPAARTAHLARAACYGRLIDDARRAGGQSDGNDDTPVCPLPPYPAE